MPAGLRLTIGGPRVFAVGLLLGAAAVAGMEGPQIAGQATGATLPLTCVTCGTGTGTPTPAPPPTTPTPPTSTYHPPTYPATTPPPAYQTPTPKPPTTTTMGPGEILKYACAKVGGTASFQSTGPGHYRFICDLVPAV